MPILMRPTMDLKQKLRSVKSVFSDSMKVVAVSKKPTKKKIPRLTSLDLQALFRRLDVDGSGSLSFAEFRNIITKLNLTSPSVIDSIHDVYKEADTDPGGGGALNLKEFVKAYDILYNRLVSDTGTEKESDPEANWVRATRYGYFGRDANSDKKYIFECYMGTMTNITTKIIYNLPNVEGDAEDPNFVPEAIDISELTYESYELTNFNIETINRLILMEGERNYQYDARVMWWVDICSKSLKDSEVTAAMKAFGISEEVHDNMSVLDDDRLYFGPGEVVCESIGKTIAPTAYLGKASNLSFFVESTHLQNKPVVDRDPWIMRAIPYGIGTYVSSRLCLFYDMSKEPCTEKQKIIKAVHDGISGILDRPLEERVNNTVETVTKGSVLNGTTNPHQTSLPLPQFDELEGDSYLLCQSDMKKRIPAIMRDNVSLHIQDQGYGPIALITVRKDDSCMVDKSSTERWTLDQRSRGGIVGHTFAGVWLKLLEVTANEGVVNIAADLDDSIFSLVITLISLLHNSSMLCTQGMDLWFRQLALEIEEIAVTKHSKHIEKIEELLGAMKNYVTVFNKTFEPLIEVHKKEVAAKQEEATLRERSESESISSPAQVDDTLSFADKDKATNEEASVPDSMGPNPVLKVKRPASRSNGVRNRPGSASAPAGPLLAKIGKKESQRQNMSFTNALEEQEQAIVYYGADGPMRTIKKGMQLERRNIDVPPEVKIIDFDNIDNPNRLDGTLVLNASKHLRSTDPYRENEFTFAQLTEDQIHEIIRDFASHNTKRRLSELLEGVPKLNLQGSVYWNDRIVSIADDIDFIRERYQLCLDEKRNFWAFTLGIVSIATFPFSVMTGYFGMNFENMAYPGGILTDTYWPVFPGYWMIWFLSLVVYAVMIMYALHFQVFYSAS